MMMVPAAAYPPAAMPYGYPPPAMPYPVPVEGAMPYPGPPGFYGEQAAPTTTATPTTGAPPVELPPGLPAYAEEAPGLEKPEQDDAAKVPASLPKMKTAA